MPNLFQRMLHRGIDESLQKLHAERFIQSGYRRLTHVEWLAVRTRQAAVMLSDCTEVSELKRGGVPVIRGTRFTAAQVLAELADGRSVAELAEDFDLEIATIKQFLGGLAIILDRPFSSEPDEVNVCLHDYVPARSMPE